MPEPPMVLSEDELEEIQNAITATEGMGSQIRALLAEHGDDKTHGVTWEVEAAVEALEVFASRWTIEILATLYIAGEHTGIIAGPADIHCGKRDFSQATDRLGANGLYQFTYCFITQVPWLDAELLGPQEW